MWARIVELIIALWLLCSLIIFKNDPGYTALFAIHLISFMSISIVCFHSFRTYPRAHLFNMVVAALLVGSGYLLQADKPLILAYQNQMVTGLTLFLISIVPSHAFLPPLSWQQFYKKKGL